MIPELFRLDGRVAFVSGAAGHLGSAMTRALLGAGADVILNGRDEARLAGFAHTLRDEAARPNASSTIRTASFDMTDLGTVRRFFSELPRLDILVNNAVAMAVKPMKTLAPEDFEITYRSSVVAAFEAVRAALPALRKGVAAAGEASIVQIASMYGLVAPDRRLYSDPAAASPAHYGPAKAALIQLTRHLAGELGSERIRVNALAPGAFPRPAVQQSDPAFAHRLAERTMLGRLGAAHEIAGPALFLASRASSYMTGATLTVDGGWTAW